jgi:hypothetical protein
MINYGICLHFLIIFIYEIFVINVHYIIYYYNIIYDIFCIFIKNILNIKYGFIGTDMYKTRRFDVIFLNVPLF